MIPVYILSGFLGSGKTTLLNWILFQNPEKKFAVIENEFGAVGIDQDLILKVDDGIFELVNGCICCTLNDDLYNVLGKLVQMNSQMDGLIIETTGIADPASVAVPFLTDSLIRKKFQLFNVITLVDAENFKLNLEEDESMRQLAFAQTIVINKMDLVSTENLNSIENEIKSINPFAKIITSKFAQFPIQSILEKPCFLPETVKTELAHKHHHSEHQGITSFSYEFDKPFDLLKLHQWLNMLLQIQYGRIFRIKGILSIYGMQNKHILQSVHKRFVIEKGELCDENDDRLSKIVVIGKELKKEVFEKSLKNCIF